MEIDEKQQVFGDSLDMRTKNSDPEDKVRLKEINRIEEPLVSVIVAVFNARSTIRETIQSIRGQTYSNVECIVIDGGSSDGTIDVLRELDGWINNWISEPDAGIYDAWNKGLTRSTGEWVAFLGAGDVYLPDALSSYMDFIRSSGDPELAFVSSRAALLNERGEVFRIVGSSWNFRNQSGKFMNVAHTGALHHRRLFDSLGLFDTSFRIAGDYELLLRAGTGLKSDFLDKVTVRMPVGGISNRSTDVFDEWFRAKLMSGKRGRWRCVVERWIALAKFHVRMTFLERHRRA